MYVLQVATDTMLFERQHPPAEVEPKRVYMALFEIISTCKGGGYMYCRTSPPHPKRNKMGLYPLHRVVMENYLERILTYNEVVHHKDEDKTNDSLDNLVLMTRSAHAALHRPTLEPVTFECATCGKEVQEKPHQYRHRIKQAKRGVLFCSHRCGAVYQWQ